MHGPAWIENPTISLILIAIAFFMLYLSLSLNRKLGKEKRHSHLARVWAQDFRYEQALAVLYWIYRTCRGWCTFTRRIHLSHL
jgi:hypothetical protein